MGKMMFGKVETLTCITDVKVTGAKDEPLCLAYKTTKWAFVAPAYLSDDGYVLAVEAGLKTYYPMPEGKRLEEMQASGLLPKPLPTYEIPTIEYVFGYMLWIVIAFTAAAMLIGNKLKQRRHASLETDQPPSAEPPVLRTEVDRWLAEEAAKHLEAGERVQHQAYGYDRDLADGAVGASALYAVLTERRLLIFQARLGAFGPLRENKGTTSFDRNRIERVERFERQVRFVFQDGSTLDFFAEWSERKLSNQRRFLRDVPRLIGGAASQGAAAGAGA
jgi:hypothetical protein